MSLGNNGAEVCARTQSCSRAPSPGPGAPEAAVQASLPQAQPPPLPTSSPTVTAKNRKSNSMTLGGNQTKVHESVIDPSPGLGLLPSRKLTLDKSKVLQE